MMEAEPPSKLVAIFPLKDPTQEQTLMKRRTLQKLEETFDRLNDDNFEQYVNYLLEWILSEVEAWAFQIFVGKLRLLYERLKLANRPDLCEQLFLINFHLLQQDDPQTRKSALQLTREMFNQPYGANFVRKFVKNLLKQPHSYPSYDSALVLFTLFKERFYSNNQHDEILSHPNLYISYKSKKILVTRLIQFVKEQLPLEVITTAMKAAERLLLDTNEVVCVGALKVKILLVYGCYRIGVYDQSRCFGEVKQYYTNQLLRVKYTIIELTKEIAEMFTKEGVEFHFQYLKANIKIDEPELAELTIAQLKHIFTKVSQSQQQSLLQELLTIHKPQPQTSFLSKPDYGIQQTIADNVIDLLLTYKNSQVLVGFLSKFLLYQSQSVKLLLVKSFFKHQSSAHLYSYFKELLDELYISNKWHTRHKTLEVLGRAMGKFGVDQDMVMRLHHLIIYDNAQRVRSDAVKLAKYFIGDRMVQENLVPMVLGEVANTDYLRRIMVLLFIQETALSLINQQHILANYRKVLEILSKDKIVNVSDLARRLLNETHNSH